MGVARATIPAVAATESWNPIDQTNQGSKMRRTRMDAARIEAALFCLPRAAAESERTAMAPARITEGSAPVMITKKTTVAAATANRDHRDRRRSDARPST